MIPSSSEELNTVFVYQFPNYNEEQPDCVASDVTKDAYAEVSNVYRKRKSDVELESLTNKSFFSNIKGKVSLLTGKFFSTQKDEFIENIAKSVEDAILRDDVELASKLISSDDFYINCKAQEARHLLDLVITDGGISNENKSKLLRLLLKYEICWDQENEGGEYPLHLTVINDNFELTKILIEHHHKTNSLDGFKNTPLYYAKTEEIAGALIRANCDIFHKNSYEMTALQWACLRGYTDGVKAILEIARTLPPEKYHALINEKDWTCRTALHWAVVTKNFDSMNLLLEYEADFTIKDESGKTPLHYADREESVNALVAKGSKVNEKDDQGMTPLHFACMNNYIEVITALVINGASVDEKDGEGMTPFAYASKETMDALFPSAGGSKKRIASSSLENKSATKKISTAKESFLSTGKTKRKPEDDLSNENSKTTKRSFLYRARRKVSAIAKQILFDKIPKALCYRQKIKRQKMVDYENLQ